MLPPTVPLKSSMPRATPYSVMEVPRMGMSAGGGLGCLQGGGAVGHDQVYAGRDEAVADGGAGRGIVLGVLQVKSDGVAQLLGQRILEALGGGVQRLVLHQLADADGIALGRGGGAVCGRRGRCRRSGGGRSRRGGRRRTAAGCQDAGSGRSCGNSQKRTTGNLTHSLYSPLLCICPGDRTPGRCGRACGPPRRFTRVKCFMIVKYSTLWGRIQDVTLHFIHLKCHDY